MSDVTINIELDKDSLERALRVTDPKQVLGAIQRGMKRGIESTATKIQRQRLVGKGPFPPSLHRLGEVSTQLRQSVRTTAPVIEGNAVTGAIGSPVVYARVHEFGFSGTVRCRSKRGKSFTRKMNMPERAPFRTGIEENKDLIKGEVSSEIDKTFNQ